MEKTANTPINPAHYKSYSVETIDMMVAIYGKEKVGIHCELTAFKYRQRLGKKDSLEQDLAKEQWYLDKAKELRSTIGETKKVSKMDIALHLGINVDQLEITD